jgi:hypothetical protein
LRGDLFQCAPPLSQNLRPGRTTGRNVLERPLPVEQRTDQHAAFALRSAAGLRLRAHQQGAVIPVVLVPHRDVRRDAGADEPATVVSGKKADAERQATGRWYRKPRGVPPNKSAFGFLYTKRCLAK